MKCGLRAAGFIYRGSGRQLVTSGPSYVGAKSLQMITSGNRRCCLEWKKGCEQCNKWGILKLNLFQANGDPG